jgi:hypothetical protein
MSLGLGIGWRLGRWGRDGGCGAIEFDGGRVMGSLGGSA